MISQSDVNALFGRLVSPMLFRSSLADLQKPFASAPMTRLGQPNQCKYELVPTLLAFPFPVAIHLAILSSLPVRERMKRVLVQRPARFSIPPRIVKTLATSRPRHPPPAPRQMDPH